MTLAEAKLQNANNLAVYVNRLLVIPLAFQDLANFVKGLSDGLVFAPATFTNLQTELILLHGLGILPPLSLDRTYAE